MAKKKSTNQKISLDQFRSWLQGVEDMQADEWTPNSDQWKVIREKIDLILSTADEQQPMQPQYAPPPIYNQPNPYLQPHPSYMPPLPPVLRPPLETATVIDNTGQATTIAVQPASSRSEFE